jgi:hypothetical protein
MEWFDVKVEEDSVYHEYALKVDRTPENVLLSVDYLYRIIHFVNERGSVTAHDIYIELDLADIPMYLALHTLCKTGFIQGLSPYHKDIHGNHDDWHYGSIKSEFVLAA